MSKHLTQSPIWQQLEQAAIHIKSVHLKTMADDSARAKQFLFRHAGIALDISKQKITPAIFDQLITLAQQADIDHAIKQLQSGAIVNESEKRAALHTALRQPKDQTLIHEQTDVIAQVHTSLNKMEHLVDKIHHGHWRGYSGRTVRDIVNIGVGGSDLGPAMCCFALEDWATSTHNPIRLHFISSIDGSQLASLLPTLDAQSTLFIISSKSFTTTDTMTNAQTALDWILSKTSEHDLVRQQHFIGVSTRPDLMTAWGIDPAHQLLFWPWVGGRFSMWSVIGLPIALRIGMAGFKALLNGAYTLDQHFATAPLAQNLPVILAMIAIWNVNFLDIQAHSVLPYDGRLKLLPNFLTQLEMESNGKSIRRGGETVNYQTCPIIWGDIGPNAQHAFFQLLHQGTQRVSLDFIATIYRRQTSPIPNNQTIQHQLSLANCLAQSRVFMMGDAANDQPTEHAHTHYHGDTPSTTLLLDELTPEILGSLIALFEHKVYVMACIWDINPFDQWGVELGKHISSQLMPFLTDSTTKPHTHGLDASSLQLLGIIKNASAS